MARVSISLPEQFGFRTELPVYISMINRADHLGNHEIVALMNEARVRYIRSLGLDEKHVLGHGLINADLAVEYKSEGHYGDVVVVEVAACDFHKYGCDFVYRLTHRDDGRLIALAKTGMLLFDYQAKRPVAVGDAFRQLFTQS